MPTFLYHYHAEYRTAMRVISIDGIASLVAPIEDMNSYRALKSVIVKDLDPAIPAEQLVICSLSPLGESTAPRNHPSPAAPPAP